MVIEHVLRFSVSCAATETVVLTAVNSLTPSLVPPPRKCHLSPSRDRLPENKSFGAGLRDGPSAGGAWSRICSVLCIQHMDIPYKLWLRIVYNKQAMGVQQGICQDHPRCVRFKVYCSVRCIEMNYHWYLNTHSMQFKP